MVSLRQFLKSGVLDLVFIQAVVPAGWCIVALRLPEVRLQPAFAFSESKSGPIYSPGSVGDPRMLRHPVREYDQLFVAVIRVVGWDVDSEVMHAFHPLMHHELHG